MGIIRTGKMVSAEKLDALREQWRLAQSTPAIVISQRRLGPYAKTEAELSQEFVRQAINATAMELGFAEPKHDEDGDRIDYGLDFATGEVLEWDGKP
jgi:hypothetical protein